MQSFQYQIGIDAEKGLVRICTAGVLGLDSAKSMVAEARKVAVAHRYPLLYDFRQLRLPVQTPLALVVRFPFLTGLPRGTECQRSAALVAAEQLCHPVWEAYRISSRLCGMHWNYFGSETEALHWLFERNHWDIQRPPPRP